MGSENKRGSLFLRTVIPGLLVLAIVVSGTGLIKEHLESRERKEEQESLVTLASRTNWSQADMGKPELSPIDFDALRAVNPDVVGWIQIPGTGIDYPIVQTGDNETYLSTGFRGEISKHGTIYLDCDSQPDFSGFNNPIYGHNMKDGSMFRDVVKFKDESFLKEHQSFFLYTPQRIIRLKAIGCCSSDSNGIVRKTEFKSRESFERWVKERLAPCTFAQMPQEPVQSMFVLVTCSYEQKDARTLLYAVEADCGKY